MQDERPLWPVVASVCVILPMQVAAHATLYSPAAAPYVSKLQGLMDLKDPWVGYALFLWPFVGAVLANTVLLWRVRRVELEGAFLKAAGLGVAGFFVAMLICLNTWGS
jgi:hypothetical protein